MQLLRQRDVPRNPRDRVYAMSRLRPVLAWLVPVTILAAMYLRHAPAPLLYIVGGFFLLVGLFGLRMLTGRFRSSNWQVRMTEAGLYLNMRSYLNHHFPADRVSVVYLPFKEISTARRVKQKVEVRDSDGDPMTRVHKLVELSVGESTEALAQAVKADAVAPRVKTWYGSGSMSYGDYPVRVSAGGSVLVEWHARPGMDAFLQDLSRHVRITPEVEVDRTFRQIQEAGRADQETLLLEMVQAGHNMDAIKFARELYGMDIREAKAFVESLAGM